MDHENIAEEETVMSQQILFQGTLKKKFESYRMLFRMDWSRAMMKRWNST